MKVDVRRDESPEGEMISSMHVVVIAHYAPWLLNFRLPMLRAIKATGAFVTVVVPNPSIQLRLKLLEHGIDCFHYPLERTGINPKSDLLTLSALTRIIRAIQPTHVLTTAIKPNIYGILASSLASVRNSFAMVTGLGYAFTNRAGKRQHTTLIASALYKLSFIYVSKVIFQNVDDRGELIKRNLLTKDKAAIIAGSGVDLTHYLPAQLDFSSPIKFLMIARIIKEKGVIEYIEAARYLRDWGINAKAVLVGPIDRNPTALSKLDVEGLNVDGAVDYIGELNDVRPALADCHVFVLPSYREGTPRSTLEAMATGRAIISTDAPGCRETVVDGRNGILVPVGDSYQLALAMKELAEDYNLVQAMGNESLNIVREKYDVTIVNNTILQIMGLADRGGRVS